MTADTPVEHVSLRCRYAPLDRHMLGRPEAYLLPGVWSGDDGELGEAAQDEAVAVAPVQLLDGHGEAELREPAEQRARARAGLPCGRAGRRGRSGCRARTRGVALSVRSMSSVPGRRSGRVVPVRRGQVDDDLRAGRDRHAAERRSVRVA